MVDITDDDDRPVGQSTLKDCLRDGLLHRAIAVVVRRRGGEIILQRRSRKDAWHPGLLTLSCTGHVKGGETYAQAAVRELDEELGLRAALKFLGRFRVPLMESGGLIESEWVGLFEATSDEELHLDLKELDEARPYTRSEVLGLMNTGEMTPDAAFLLANYFESVRDDPGPL